MPAAEERRRARPSPASQHPRELAPASSGRRAIPVGIHREWSSHPRAAHLAKRCAPGDRRGRVTTLAAAIWPARAPPPARLRIHQCTRQDGDALHCGPHASNRPRAAATPGMMVRIVGVDTPTNSPSEAMGTRVIGTSSVMKGWFVVSGDLIPVSRGCSSSPRRGWCLSHHRRRRFTRAPRSI